MNRKTETRANHRAKPILIIVIFASCIFGLIMPRIAINLLAFCG